jgi:uncharacterized membrane protein YbaN (DUF454 family)
MLLGSGFLRLCRLSRLVHALPACKGYSAKRKLFALSLATTTEFKQLHKRFRKMKILINIVGSLALILAILGLFLPLLPTTPFLLLASACYARGSKRMQKWLHNNRLFGEYIRNYEEGKGIPLKAKVTAVLLLWTSLILSGYHAQSTVLKAVLLAVGVAITTYLIRVRTYRPGNRGFRDDTEQRTE